ncbi:pPIWI_RE_Y domain-containing protein [Sphaerisporangium corydalis]|uniref:Fis family transcriptional regulator n=1 Tax=Sphaerisporangium corydalis TaxID=1441875 RepID=A0ABV9EP21_9ACTN|nr:hypothetical protein [Sphaerisporangium corydalis]
MSISAPHETILLLHTLATALVNADRRTGLDSFHLPYDDEAQRALDRTVLACLLRGAEPPASLAELFSWCRERPLSDWPLDSLPDTIGPDDHLLDPGVGRPTELCFEWKTRSQDSAAEHRDREVIRKALRLCLDAGEPEAYTAFRGLLIEQPVLTSTEAFAVMSDLMLEPVRSILAVIYQEVSDGLVRDHVYATCARCLTLLTPVQDGQWWCERDRCRRVGPPPVGREIDSGEDLRQLERPLRQFVTGPGQAEVSLERRLRLPRLVLEMWPNFDSYDLRLTFPDGQVWAIDVKDWAHPYFLGRAAKPVPPTPPYDEAFWVVPAQRVQERPGYLEIFARNRPASAADLILITDDALIRKAKARLKENRRA